MGQKISANAYETRKSL